MVVGPAWGPADSSSVHTAAGIEVGHTVVDTAVGRTAVAAVDTAVDRAAAGIEAARTEMAAAGTLVAPLVVL